MKKRLIIISVSVLTFLCIYFYFFDKNTKEEEVEDSKTALLLKQRLSVPRLPANLTALKTLKPSLKFKESFKEPKIENLTMIGTVERFGVEGDEGKLFRALRFKNITDTVENMYNLPPNILLAMMAQESSGVDLLPNGLDDGGFGLCHMQPQVAREFGLRVYAGCKKMVCKEHGTVKLSERFWRKTSMTENQ